MSAETKPAMSDELDYALRSALRFAASRSAITAEQENAILAAVTRQSAAPASEAAEPVAWLHTLLMEGGQLQHRLSFRDGRDPDEPSRTAFGIPGRDYSEEYPVTSEPLFSHPSESAEAVELLREALEAYQSIFTPAKDGGVPGLHPEWGKMLDAALINGANALAKLDAHGGAGDAE